MTKQAGPMLAESGGESTSPAENQGGCGRDSCSGCHILAASGRRGCGSWLRETAGAPHLSSGVTVSVSGLLETEGAQAGTAERSYSVGKGWGTGQQLRDSLQQTPFGATVALLRKLFLGFYSCLTFYRHCLPFCDSPICTKQGVNPAVVGALLI